MIEATPKYRNKVVEILAGSFDENKSVNYIAKQGKHRKERINRLMKYSFDVCSKSGKVFISDDGNACALVLYPEGKRTTLNSIWLDVKLAISCIGIKNIRKVMAREAGIKNLQPPDQFCYMWFIGVDPMLQGQGIGTAFMKELLDEIKSDRQPICLETSTVRNIPWYKKFGFRIYAEENFGYTLYFLIRD